MTTSRTDPMWTDPLYRPRTTLPEDAERRRFGTVEAAVVVADTDPGTVEASYLPDRGVTLIVGDDVTADELAAALPEFRDFATASADRPTTASLTLPSRDVMRRRVARAAGFAPSASMAIASPNLVAASAPDADGPDVTMRGVEVRDATPADAVAVAELWIEQTDYEARVGTLRSSEAIRAAIRASVPLTVPGDGEALVAEVDGRLVGLILAQSVAASGWASGRVAVRPAAYLSVASTAASHRGHGVGRALVAELHARYRTAGVAASLLHYGVDNPLSVPFWSRCGYRPLVTTHELVVA